MTHALVIDISTPPSLLKLFGRAVLSRKRSVRRGETLPNILVKQRGIRADPGQVAAYAALCGFAASDYLPLTYPSVASFPLQIELLTHERFPVPMVGIVHVSNRIVQHRPIGVREELDFEYEVGDTRTVDKGVEFDLHATARVGTEAVWASSSTLLRRLPGGPEDSAPRKQPAAPLAGTREEWALPSDLGRRFARVSGDYNPIHLSALTARPLGFPRAIAHGMWSKARCVAALGARLGSGRAAVEVRFKQPVLLPTEVAFIVVDAEDGTRFELQSSDGDKVHVSGTLRL